MPRCRASNASFHAFFFFSSRRRHTRLQGDWSSDVCSSDLQRDRVRNDLELEVDGGDRNERRQEGRRHDEARRRAEQNGREAGRGRVEVSVGGVSFKKKKNADR